MNLYLISQSVNNGWDTFSNAVVAAESESAARMIHPRSIWADSLRYTTCEWDYLWCALNDVEVKLIGVAVQGTLECVICASFHAG